MTDFKWSPPISVNGRPDWLADDVRCAIRQNGIWFGENGTVVAGQWLWGEHTTAMYVPVDHPASICQGWNDAHTDEPPFVPWCGGKKSPNDWDDLWFILRSGEAINYAILDFPRMRWEHLDVHNDIVGYRPKAASIRPTPTDYDDEITPTQADGIRKLTSGRNIDPFVIGDKVQRRPTPSGKEPAYLFKGTVCGSYANPVTGDFGRAVSLDQDPGCIQIFPDYMLELRPVRGVEG